MRFPLDFRPHPAPNEKHRQPRLRPAAKATVDIIYDANARVTQRKLSSGATTYALGQTSYDVLGRTDCSTVRMNGATFASPPASACTLGTQGSFGPDRIGKTIYDAAGQITQKQVAVGTADVATEATLAYSNNGKLQTLKDAENNLTTYEYDGFDRLAKTRMPLPTKGSNASSTTEYKQLTYDAGSNVTSRRLRDAQSIGFTYDNLDRVTLKDLPGAEPDVTYGYDALSRLTSASQTGSALSFTYDALSRNLTQVGPQGTVTSAWDIAGRRTQLTYPGSGLFLTYDYLLTNEATAIRENGAVSGVGVLATFGYDDLGRRTGLTRGNGAVTSYAFDPVSRLATLAENFTGTTNDQSATFTYSPASQIGSVTRTNDAYAWTGHGSGSTASVANGLNQLATIGGAATTHDARGNLTTDPTTGKTYTYTSENLLTASTGGAAASLAYDPAMRLRQIVGASTTRFGYDGTDMIAEYNGSDVLQRRFVHGPGVDEPLVHYEGSATTDRRWLHADERGSIIAISDGGGNVTTINRYDEYGKPQATNVGRFQYTGQTWLPEIGAYYYKARIYSPTFGGRFLQTDPIDVAGGINLYAYVGNDPVNLSDPSGTLAAPDELVAETEEFRGSGRVWDWMGIMGRASGGMLEAKQFEQSQAELWQAVISLNNLSAKTGIGAGCLLSAACTSFMLAGMGNTPLGGGSIYFHGGNVLALMHDNTFAKIQNVHTLGPNPVEGKSYFFKYFVWDKATFSAGIIVPALSSRSLNLVETRYYTQITSVLPYSIGINIHGNVTNVVVIRGVFGVRGGAQGFVISNAFPGTGL